MRVQPWFAPILGLVLMLLGRQDLHAQSAPFPPNGPGTMGARPMYAPRTQTAPPPGFHFDQSALLAGFPTASSGASSSSQAAESGFDSTPFGPTGVGGMGADPYALGMLPYPAVSPYDNRFDQTVYKEGLWTRLVNNDSRKYTFNVDFLAGELRRPTNRRVGNEVVEETVGMAGPVSYSLERGYVDGDSTREGESVFPFDFKSEGIRGEWGFEDPDGSRFRVDGWWLSDTTEQFDTTIIRIGGSGVIGANDGSAMGVLLGFDTRYRLTYQTEAFGSGAEFLLTPWKKGPHHAIRPMWGVRYLNVQEKLGFHGDDSTLPAGITTLLESWTESHLVGPEIGFAWEVGGEMLKIFGESKFGVMFNREKIALSGQNFGDPALFTAGVDIPFVEKRYTAHASPSFESSFVAEMKVLQLIPIINRYEIFEHATFRVGFTYMAAYEVARPGDTIVYNALPLVPTIEHNRSKWHAEWWNFGLNWTY